MNQSSVPRFMNVKQVADYLQLNEKKVYTLVSEGKIPGTKITGKWLFPRELIDQWMLESSHGGVLTDRLVLAGSDDPLLYRAIMHLAAEMQSHALVSYSCTGTQLGLSLLARQRADVCAMHWGPAAESHYRHPALLRHYPQHHDWILVRIFQREQGLIVAPNLLAQAPDAGVTALLATDLRWAMRQEGAGSQRYLQETCTRYGIDSSRFTVVVRAYSERDAAATIAMGHADIAPGARSAAREFGLAFVPIGWEAFDLALPKRIYFRTLFQKLLEYLKGSDCQTTAQRLGGYDFSEIGRLIWTP